MSMKPFLSALCALLLWSSGVWADTYYCLIFAYDSKPIPIPCQCHIWGTFIRLDDDGKLAQEISLSWAPDKISPLDRSRPGRNLTLEETMSGAHRRSVRMWGPFEIDKLFFAKAVEQHQCPGHYKFIDGPFWRHRAQNCIHRLSDIAGPHKTGVYWGWWAADSVYQHYNRNGLLKHTEKDIPGMLPALEGHTIKRMGR